MGDWPQVVHLDISVSEVDTYEVAPGNRSTLDLVRTKEAYRAGRS
jgi:hypothetical protein